MRRVVFLLTMCSSIAVLSSCGPLKQSTYHDNRSVVASREASIQPSLQDTEHYYGGVDTGVAHDDVSLYAAPRKYAGNYTSPHRPMFTSRRYIGEQPITSKPMFTMKKRGVRPGDHIARKFNNWVGTWDQIWPVGYTGPRQTPPQPKPRVEKNIEPQVHNAVDPSRVDRMLSSISGDRYVPPLQMSYAERQMMSKYGPMGLGKDYEDRYDVLEYDENSGVYVSGEVAEQAFFGHGSSRIKADDAKELRRFARDIGAEDSRYKVSVVGHASKRVDGVKDPRKREQINYRMAEKRAHAVSKELKRGGVDSGMVVAISKGDAEPNPYPGEMSQEEADRRVDIYLDDLYYYY